MVRPPDALSIDILLRREIKKTWHLMFHYNFGKYEPIL